MRLLLVLFTLVALGIGNAHAGGVVSAGVSVGSGTVVHGGPTVVRDANVAIHHYPNGRVAVERYPVTHVFPHGVTMDQRGGNVIYRRGYGGPSTCYVDCFHGGVHPGARHGRVVRGGGTGTSWHFSAGVTHRW